MFRIRNRRWLDSLVCVDLRRLYRPAATGDGCDSVEASREDG